MIRLVFATWLRCRHCHVRAIIAYNGSRGVALLCPNCDGPEVDGIIARGNAADGGGVRLPS